MKVNFESQQKLSTNGWHPAESGTLHVNGKANGTLPAAKARPVALRVKPAEPARNLSELSRDAKGPKPPGPAAKFRSLVDSSFRVKVLVPVVGCLVLAVAVMLFVVDRELARRFDTDARRTLLAANEVVRYSQESRRNDLLLRFHNLPRVPLWNEVFQSGAPKDLHETLLSLMDMQKVDIVFYTSNKGKILDIVNNATVPQSEFEAAASGALLLALEGSEKADTVRVAGNLYDVFAIPAYDPSGKQIGTLVLGSELGAGVAREFSKITQCAVALVADGHVIASTLPGVDISGPIAAAFGSALPVDPSPRGKVRPVVINGGQYYAVSGRFESLAGDGSLGYVLLSSRDRSLAEKAAAQHFLLDVGLFAILIGGLAVYFFINKATVPLRELRQGAEAVERGEFSRRVPVRSRDECGQLAQVFNQMMESIVESRARLEKNVEQLKSTQEQLQEQLVFSAKLSSIGEFVAGVAHELNNPLGAVVGFSELLIRKPDEGNRAHYYDVIFKSALRCKKVVQSLLSFVRRDKPKREVVAVNGLVESVLDLTGYSLRTSKIEVTTELEPELPPVLADANQIQQVLLNLLTNAQQAMEGKQPSGKIKIITEFQKPNVRITIQDNGPGIPADVMPRLFDPFFTTKEAGKGTGLGLSLCHKFVAEHGGTITPVSQEGNGAAFIIDLPACEDAPAKAEPAVTDAIKIRPHQGQGKRVLVINDEEAMLTVIREALSSRGYEVKIATDGEKALSELKANNFDLAVCDWKVPGLCGREIYERLRATNSKICRRMIFVTGDIVNQEMRQFLEVEKRPCLAKPFTLPEFHTAVDDVIAAN